MSLIYKHRIDAHAKDIDNEEYQSEVVAFNWLNEKIVSVILPINMKLKSIILENYKSIEKLEIQIEDIGGSFTYSLLGINESGKSSILKAISYFEDGTINYPSDFHNPDKNIQIVFNYIVEENELIELREELVKKYHLNKEVVNDVIIKDVSIYVEYSNAETPELTRYEIPMFEIKLIKGFTYSTIDGKVVKKTKSDENDLDLEEFFGDKLSDYFYQKSHYIVFWQSTPEYLLLDDIDLLNFSEDPSNVSIPLKNCFTLAGISSSNIKREINKLNNSVAINSLQSRLSDYTTNHINGLWPEHPISITFQISDQKISLLIEDNGVKYSPKTASQRSDGFKQFLSFLLTVAVENKGSELERTILLIDEPETHLHPPAQINLLKELINISSNKKENIVFFATHSNYLIDKEYLDRNYKVTKQNNQKTIINRIERKSTSYAEVNYDIFEILTNDYHNELYGFIEAEDKTKLEALPKDKKWYNDKNKKTLDVSLSEYVRHSIHHPENTENKKVSEKELKKSIDTLLKLKIDLKNK
ncbi:MAG: ATP-binding protein [Sphingobacterium mizutaii]|nr:ATP-binding protein [Sphingobacterium mizutaii]